jgi:hypothetical protein
MTGISPIDIKVPKIYVCVSKAAILTVVYKFELRAENGVEKDFKKIEVLGIVENKEFEIINKKTLKNLMINMKTVIA